MKYTLHMTRGLLTCRCKHHAYVRGGCGRFLTSGEHAPGGSAVVKLFAFSWPLARGKPAVEELREFQLEGSSPPIVLSRFKGCLASNGRYALRAVDQQLYVWNLDTRQLTAIIQHENGAVLPLSRVLPCMSELATSRALSLPDERDAPLRRPTRGLE